MNEASSGPSTILIIDDDRAVRVALSTMVESLGFRAVNTGNGIEGLRLVNELRPAVVLLDVVMPQIDGYKIAGAIKAQPRFVPVILLTGLNDVESKRRGQAAGADDFLSKPVSPIELQIRIAAMLRIKSLTDALDAANARLRELALTDGLTQIPNRRSVEEALKSEMVRMRRYRRPLSVLLVDIDHFKRINDTRGHATGDLVLKAVAKALADSLRQTDRVGRWGGEEFCIVAPETDVTNGLLLGERLRQRVEREGGAGTGLTVTVSIGVSGAAFEELEDLAVVERADVALYRAKEAGRNRVEVSPDVE